MVNFLGILSGVEPSREAKAYAAELERSISSRAENDVRIIFSAASYTVVWSTILLIVAAYAGAWDQGEIWKKMLVGASLLAAVYHTAGVFGKILPLAEVLVILFRVSQKGNQEAIAGIPRDLINAFQVLAWVFSSECVTALIVWFVPFHAYPTLIPPFFVASLGAMGWAIFESKGKLWVRILGTVSLGVIVVSLIGFITTLSPRATAKIDEAKKWLNEKPTESKPVDGQQQSAAPREIGGVMRELVLCPGDEKQVNAGTEITFAIGADSSQGCFTNWTHIPSAGRAEAWLIYPGGMERGPFLVDSKDSLNRYMQPEYGRPHSFRVKAITDIAVNGYHRG